jgi:hypothetical protein
MHVRTRNDVHYLEHTEYTRAGVDPGTGASIKPSRKTVYLGMFPISQRFVAIPADVLAKFTPKDLAQLKELLAPNEPWGDECLARAAGAIIDTYGGMAALKGATGERRERILGRIKAIDEAYETFFKACQGYGFRKARKSKTEEVAA